jgi:2-polyprenyl-3-methyl-5-hydroxy-6-metoxy-1,4-benzoquinol methylase
MLARSRNLDFRQPTAIHPYAHAILAFLLKPSASDLLRRHYPESRYGGFSDVDGTVTFYSRVRSLVSPSAVVLDVGCGRGGFLDDPVPFRRSLRFFKGSCKAVIGIDVDEGGAQNPSLDEFRVIRGTSWPIDDASVDVCISDWVIEHVPDPSVFLLECRRVLKDGGYLCMRTMNLVSYVGLASRILPNRLHKRVLGRVQPARGSEDVFPTFYRGNTQRTLNRAMERAGFSSYVYGHHPEPTYLAFSPLIYRLGVWQQRITPRRFGVTLLAFGHARLRE